MPTTPHIPIFPCSGNRVVAVNPAFVRSVESQANGLVKIVFDRQHEIIVEASLQSVVASLWTPHPLREVKELTFLEP